MKRMNGRSLDGSLPIYARISTISLVLLLAPGACAADLADWKPVPADWQRATIRNGTATLTSNAGKSGWQYLLAPDPAKNVELSTTLTIRVPAKEFSFFGSGWSVWPDKLFGDRGWEACLLLRAGDKSGYRVQVSYKLQEIALVKFPDGGYLRSVPCPIKLNQPLTLVAQVGGNVISVLADGTERLSYIDDAPLPAGTLGVGVNSAATVEFAKTAAAPAAAEQAKRPAHKPAFNARKWLGERLWVFDGAEPIMLLPDPTSTYINNVKLRPGVRPLLSFNSHWDIQNQGAFAEGKNETVDVKTTGGGDSLTVAWSGKHVADRFSTRSEMLIRFDRDRQVFTYDVDSELEVKGQPFHFRYGFDFEHHTPLDPFNWQYLLFRRKDGVLNRRPVYPIDPGPQNDLETSSGLRVWHGRHNDPVPVCPAVEYTIPGVSKQKLNTAVCAAFYDTGVAFEPATLPAGAKVQVHFRYTGYPAEETAKLFKESVVYDSPTLDPKQHWIFAEWPKTSFAQFVPLSDTWIYGRSPFISAHNARPTYELVKNTGFGSGFAMKLGPRAYGAARLPAPGPSAAGHYALSVKAKGENLHGPGGRIELVALDKTGKEIIKQTHFAGGGTFAWKEAGFAFDLPAETKSLTLAFGNAGTGAFLVTDAEVTRRADGMQPLAGVAAAANPNPVKPPPAPAGAIADYRMIEGAGLHAHDFAAGPFGPLELANLDWANDDGKPALRFADNVNGAKRYPTAGKLDLNYLRHPGYAKRDTLPVALAGTHGGGFDLPAFSLVTWIKPAAAMGRAERDASKGDVLGVGARRIILRLVGQKPPYQLQTALNVGDVFTADSPRLEADRWYQVAVTGEPTADKKWRIRLFLDGQEVKEGVTKKFEAPLAVPPSAILGAEIFYFHDAYYRGLIGRTLIFNRAVKAEELAKLTPKVE
jgi:hypothetical protein